MLLKISTVITLTFAVLFAWTPYAVANPVSIQFDLTALGGNSYRYDYTVHNNVSLGTNAPVQLFDVLFDPTLYQESSLALLTPAPLQTTWDIEILHSVGSLPAAYDAFALTSGVPAGGTVSGFAVQFLWLGGPEGPGSQPFEIYDANSFALLQTGNTASALAVPEPSSVLLLTGCMGLWLQRKRFGTFL